MVISIILLIIIALAIAGYFVWLKVDSYLTVHSRLAAVGDPQMTMESKLVTIKLLNASNIPEIWNSHESKLKAYFGDVEIPSTFERHPSLPNGLIFRYAPKLEVEHLQAIISALSFNNIYISHDGGETKFWANSVKEKFVTKIVSKFEDKTNTLESLKQGLRKEIESSEKYFHFSYSDKFEKANIISHINEGMATQTTLRLQLVIPKSMSEQDSLQPKDQTKFFHIFEGKLYPLKTRFINNVDDYWEWEFYDLEPNTAYIGIGFTNNGVDFFPSTSMYGVTKDEDGGDANINDAEIRQPKLDPIDQPIWSKEASMVLLGEGLTEINNDVLAKKHYEHDNPGQFITLEKARSKHDLYDWLVK